MSEETAGLWVLDSYAILALLQKDPGFDDVLEQLERAQQGSAILLMTWVNVGEVLYIVERRRGKESVHQVLGLLEASAIKLIDVDRDLALAAATIKASNPLAYADAFAAALAIQQDAQLMTGDHEFRYLEDRIAIHWLPSRSPNGATT
jgi:ribonuclease VapC